MLIRVVLLLVLILLAVRFAYLLIRIARRTAAGGGAPRGVRPPIELVRCRRCEVMVPRPRAVSDGPDGYLCRSCAGR